ncbi:hypothetical protein SULPSESMR1_03800 (plasmid) [Pseudosulfitobacter pseudonitzschiae]|uniref:Lipoprotein n=2 Tax=Rhodobacterales TaxID=204455 RepID=A0A221K9A9_9RHOB|nr:hypothetical protein SULPSESMR1_03800 [Pseudosulfitobacter pseudonitzschiae]
MLTSRLSCAASGFFAALILSSCLLLLFGQGDQTMSIAFNAGLVVAGIPILAATRFSKISPARRRRRSMSTEHLGAHMRRDIGLDNL